MNLNKDIPVIMREDDYSLLSRLISTSTASGEEMSLAGEIRRAVVVKKDAFPAHTIRLNSRVEILDEETRLTRSLYIVMPDNANIKENKVSILSPIGAALFGFRKGETVQWKVPAGLKKFRIKDVHNENILKP
ncbi:MAG: transcription elongation factor GreAB [Pedobacter sp.]|nr:MAG: transcription elongation factor GreAB [Pedobacter sp.]